MEAFAIVPILIIGLVFAKLLWKFLEWIFDF